MVKLSVNIMQVLLLFYDPPHYATHEQTPWSIQQGFLSVFWGTDGIGGTKYAGSWFVTEISHVTKQSLA